MADQDTTNLVEKKEAVFEDADDAQVKALTKDATVKKLLSGVFKRFLELLIKLIGGKGIVLIVTTYLFLVDRVPLWAWLVAVVLFIGGRYADKLLDKLVPGSNSTGK
jgi:hypothetical protein